MAQESDRVKARKTVLLPSGDTVDIPVISRISFTDPFDRYQQTQFQVESGRDSNDQKADRRVHVDPVYPVDVDADGIPTQEAPTADEDQSLYVERIEDFKVVDPFERHQESQVNLDNTTGNDALPPHFSNHVLTHIYRYHQDPANPDDEGTWIDSELIDEFTVVDPFEQSQETHYILANPTNEEFRGGDLSGQADATDPNITIAGDDNGEGTEANPVRLDPFQNIVNYSKGGLYVLFLFTWHDFLTSPLGERCTLTQNLPPTANSFTEGIQTRAESAEVDITCTGDSFDSLVNGVTAMSGQPETVTTGQFAQGYPKFPPCFDCETNVGPVIWYPPAGEPHGEPAGFSYCNTGEDESAVFADPVPYSRYERSFLFEIAASEPDETNPTAGNIGTTKIDFDIVGLPEPRLSTWTERTLPTYPGGPGVVAFPFEEMNSNGVCQLSFTIYVFNKSAVDLYLTDKVFPLRKKGILPTAPDAVDQTKAACKDRLLSTGTVTQGWEDEANMLHEPLSDADVNTGESGTFDGFGGTGSATVNLKFHFEKFKVGPAIGNPSIVNREIAWPVEPDGQVVTGVIARANDGTPSFGPIHTRQYHWFYTINGVADNVVLAEFEKDFGEQPMHPTTA